MNPAIKSLEAQLRGWPSEALTLGLIAIGLAYIVIGLVAGPLVKAAALAYGVLP